MVTSESIVQGGVRQTLPVVRNGGGVRPPHAAKHAATHSHLCRCSLLRR